ncbi:MAG: GGDEF domain-containing protein [Sphingomicrobium sp.]
MRSDEAANDDRDAATSMENAALLEEIALLRSALEGSAARIVALDREAHVDPLVNLPNRRRFLSKLESTIARVREQNLAAAVLFLDVDGLKAINDRLGHNAGDTALVKVARLLVATVRQDDLVSRFAGDEFGILLENADELSAWRMALRIVETVDECEICVGSVRVPLSIAVGVGVIRPGDTAQAVLERADKEMYRIKAISNATLRMV